MLSRLLPALLLAALPAGVAAADLAVIVHPDNPVKALSSADLREILLMERQHWSGGQRVYLLLPQARTPAKELLLDRLFRMSDRELRRHFLSKLYAGEISSFPHVVSSGEAARRIVARVANALALVDSAEVGPSVRTVAIDGRRPGEAGYLLSRSE